jgi:hypothetical protein
MKQHQLDREKKTENGEDVSPLFQGYRALETKNVGQQMRGDQQQQVNPKHDPKIQFTELVFHSASCILGAQNILASLHS